MQGGQAGRGVYLVRMGTAEAQPSGRSVQSPVALLASGLEVYFGCAVGVDLANTESKVA